MDKLKKIIMAMIFGNFLMLVSVDVLKFRTQNFNEIL